MYSDFRMSPGLDIWLGILPPQWDEDDFDDWEDEEFSVQKKQKVIRIFRRSS